MGHSSLCIMPHAGKTRQVPKACVLTKLKKRKRKWRRADVPRVGLCSPRVGLPRSCPLGELVLQQIDSQAQCFL